jgi:hypothetical protein
MVRQYPGGLLKEIHMRPYDTPITHYVISILAAPVDKVRDALHHPAFTTVYDPAVGITGELLIIPQPNVRQVHRASELQSLELRLKPGMAPTVGLLASVHQFLAHEFKAMGLSPDVLIAVQPASMPTIKHDVAESKIEASLSQDKKAGTKRSHNASEVKQCVITNMSQGSERNAISVYLRCTAIDTSNILNHIMQRTPFKGVYDQVFVSACHLVTLLPFTNDRTMVTFKVSAPNPLPWKVCVLSFMHFVIGDYGQHMSIRPLDDRQRKSYEAAGITTSDKPSMRNAHCIKNTMDIQSVLAYHDTRSKNSCNTLKIGIHFLFKPLVDGLIGRTVHLATSNSGIMVTFEECRSNTSHNQLRVDELKTQAIHALLSNRVMLSDQEYREQLVVPDDPQRQTPLTLQVNQNILSDAKIRADTLEREKSSKAQQSNEYLEEVAKQNMADSADDTESKPSELPPWTGPRKMKDATGATTSSNASAATEDDEPVHPAFETDALAAGALFKSQLLAKMEFPASFKELYLNVRAEDAKDVNELRDTQRNKGVSDRDLAQMFSKYFPNGFQAQSEVNIVLRQLNLDYQHVVHEGYPMASLVLQHVDDINIRSMSPEVFTKQALAIAVETIMRENEAKANSPLFLNEYEMTARLKELLACPQLGVALKKMGLANKDALNAAEWINVIQTAHLHCPRVELSIIVKHLPDLCVVLIDNNRKGAFRIITKEKSDLQVTNGKLKLVKRPIFIIQSGVHYAAAVPKINVSISHLGALDDLTAKKTISYSVKQVYEARSKLYLLQKPRSDITREHENYVRGAKEATSTPSKKAFDMTGLQFLPTQGRLHFERIDLDESQSSESAGTNDAHSSVDFFSSYPGKGPAIASDNSKMPQSRNEEEQMEVEVIETESPNVWQTPKGQIKKSKQMEQMDQEKTAKQNAKSDWPKLSTQKSKTNQNR